MEPPQQLRLSYQIITITILSIFHHSAQPRYPFPNLLSSRSHRPRSLSAPPPSSSPFSKARHFSLVRFQTTKSCPFFFRFPAMPTPMIPSPTNPTRGMFALLPPPFVPHYPRGSLRTLTQRTYKGRLSVRG
eukprot:767363-Hanusia_phi.AAC.1